VIAIYACLYLYTSTAPANSKRRRPLSVAEVEPGFRVQGLGFRVRVQGLGFRVSGFGLRPLSVAEVVPAVDKVAQR